MIFIKNIFDETVTGEIISRLNKLSEDSKPLWGKMSAAQMMAHCSVAYEMVYEDKYPKPGAFKRFLLKTFVKAVVVGEKPYKRNSPTAPQFQIKEEKDFETEKKRLVEYLLRTQDLGERYFAGKESHSFGPLTVREWNVMFYKHLDHHLSQFGS